MIGKLKVIVFSSEMKRWEDDKDLGIKPAHGLKPPKLFIKEASSSEKGKCWSLNSFKVQHFFVIHFFHSIHISLQLHFFFSGKGIIKFQWQIIEH